MRIVVLDSNAVCQSDLDFSLLNSLGEVAVYKLTPPDKTVERISGAEIVLTNKVVIDKDVILKCPNIRLISTLSTGYNVVDCAFARETGITVSNVPAYSTESVAQHTFALILELCARTGEHNISVGSGDWQTCADFCYCISSITELKGKTLGIIGYGAIGKAVEKIALAFGMNVLKNNRSQIKCGVSKEEIFAKSDIISLHCPLSNENAKMINASVIEMMKPTAFLINTARGGLIDDFALAEALNSGRIGGAGLDVLSKEPPRDGNPLIGAKNCIITPHIAWASTAARNRLLEITYKNIEGFLNSKPINVVN